MHAKKDHTVSFLFDTSSTKKYFGSPHSDFFSGGSRYIYPLFFHPSHLSRHSLLGLAPKHKVHLHVALDLQLEYAPTVQFAGLMAVVPLAAAGCEAAPLAAAAT